MEIWGGIECTINRVGDQYFDQLDYQGHLKRKDDIELICDLGIKKIRYPVLWERHQPDQNRPVEWGAVENNLHNLKAKKIEVIAGLVHHGCGPSYVEIMDESFVKGLACYAEQVAIKFPWINYYTPVNEPLTTARFSGLYGLWYPHKRDGPSFLRILVNECKATVLAMEAIRKINPDAKLVHTEDLGKIHSSENLKYQADFENQRRWLGIDLLCGKVLPGHSMWDYMIGSGISPKELEFFVAHTMPPDILGFNYYITSERYLDEDLERYPSNTHGNNGIRSYADIEAIRTDQVETDGPKKLLREAWERYHLPLAVTEVHLHCGREDQLRWMQYIWNAAAALAAENVELRGVTVWSLFGAYGWDKLLTAPGGNYEAGAFDIRHEVPRATALTKQIKDFAANKQYNHPVLNCPGWWERQYRIIYNNGNPASRISTIPGNCRPVLIIGSGTMAKKFAITCEERGIKYKVLINGSDLTGMFIQNIIKNYQPWVIINLTGTATTSVTINCNCYGIKLCMPIAIDDQRREEIEQQVLFCNPNALIVRTDPFSDCHDLVHITLDFLIDDEKGIWQMTADGTGNLIRSVFQQPFFAFHPEP